MAAVFLAATGPPAPIPLDRADPGHVLRGAFHIHTDRSDGTLPKPDVAAAAARAGLDFAIFTDHGDGTRPPDPPEYLHGVLAVDGVEISTNDGHYVALGMPAAPYPLGGDAAAVAEDVARLGGFGVAAHPMSPRADLSWSDWSVPVDGLEWLNADSEWRDETRLRLFRAFLDYLWRPEGALARLLDRPESALATWDRLTRGRPVVGLAAHDAHGGFGPEGGDAPASRRLHIPSYEASFRAFALYVALSGPPTGEAARDAELLLDAIRAGRLFTAIDAIAGPATFEFLAVAGEERAAFGEGLALDSLAAQFTVRASTPPGARVILLRNGDPVADASGGVLQHRDETAGAYRVEIHVPGAPGTPPVPWLVSNPIYRLPAVEPAAPVERHVVAASLPVGQGWREEASTGSSARVTDDGYDVSLQFRLDSTPDVSQFAALAAPLADVPASANEIVFRGRADRPMRVSVQLRFAGHDAARWTTSVYLDRATREIRIPIERLRAADTTGSRPSVSTATSILFVVDLVNARPGGEGRFTVSDVRVEERRGD